MQQAEMSIPVLVSTVDLARWSVRACDVRNAMVGDVGPGKGSVGAWIWRRTRVDQGGRLGGQAAHVRQPRVGGAGARTSTRSAGSTPSLIRPSPGTTCRGCKPETGSQARGQGVRSMPTTPGGRSTPGWTAWWCPTTEGRQLDACRRQAALPAVLDGWGPDRCAVDGRRSARSRRREVPGPRGEGAWSAGPGRAVAAQEPWPTCFDVLRSDVDVALALTGTIDVGRPGPVDPHGA